MALLSSNQDVKACMWFLRSDRTMNHMWAWEDRIAMAGRNSTLNEIINEFLTKLFAPEKQSLQSRILEMIQRNAQFMGNIGTNGFRYKGETYSNLANATRFGNNTSLHTDLFGDMDTLLVEKKELDYDRARVKAGLIILLQSAYTDQDYRDAAPNCLAVLVDRLSSLPRTREEAYTLKDDPQKMHQYKKVVSLIEYHAASRYLY